MTAKIPLEVTYNGDDADRGLKNTGKAVEDLGDSGKKAGLSLTDLKSGIDLAKSALQEIQAAYDGTIGKTVAYAEQVRDLERVSGKSAEESSRTVQMLDDLKVGYETITAAAKALAKDGLALTTEELAKSSDEYLALTDAGERAEYATKKFGRAGMELTKVLETGGDALREMADGQSENLILTQDQIDKARELEKAQDALEDSMAGLNYQISMKLIPSVTAFIGLWNDLLSLDNKRWFQDGADAAANFINQVFYGKKDVHAFAEEARYLEGKFDNMADAAKDAERQNKLFNEEMTKAATEANKFRVALNDLDITERNTTSAQKALTDQNAALKDSQKALNDQTLGLINDAMKPLTAELIYQKAAAGLDAQAALDLAKSMGLVNDNAYNTLTQIQKLRDQLIAGQITLEEYTQKVKALAAGDYLVKIRADFSDLDAALAKSSELNKLGTAGISGPTFSWTPPTGGTTTKPKTTTPSIPGETGATSSGPKGTLGNPVYGGMQADGGVYEVDKPTAFIAGDGPGKETAIFIPEGKKLAGGGNSYHITINGWQGDARSLAAEMDRQERIRRVTS